MKFGRLNISILDLMLVFVPLAIVMKLMDIDPVWIFTISCLAIVPLAGWMGKATEHLAGHYGPGIGGLLNASFGNAAELIIAIMALRAGYIDVVKATLTGSIIGNILLVLGLSFLCGGLKHKRQKFNATSAGLGSTMLLLSAIGLLVPGMFSIIVESDNTERLQTLSRDIAIVLFVTYLLSLVFQLLTHRHLFREGDANPIAGLWSRSKAIVVLIIATVFIAWMSEQLVGSVEHTAEAWGMSQVFIGVILLAIVGNAAEHSTAVLMALKNKMNLSINIAVGSGIQIALFVAPLLVFLSYAITPAGTGPMDLVFTPFELVAVVVSVLVVESVSNDGESHWMEGVLLLAVYVIIGMAFYFLPG